MGLFSDLCMVCEHPILSGASCNDINEWMTEAVSISEYGEIHVGQYDGYGSVGGSEYAIGNGATVYHKACWEVLGKPLDFRGPAKWAPDQGYFFDDPEHDMPDPRQTSGM